MAGKKGKSGRKGKYQEIADAQLLWDLFSKDMTRSEVRKKLASGKYSIKDVFVSKAYAGSERMIELMVRKLFPDYQKTEIDNPKQTEELEKLYDKFVKFFDNERPREAAK